MRKRFTAGRAAVERRSRRKAKLKRRIAPKAGARRTSSTAGEETDVARLTRELNEALEQQTATSEVLQVISSSPGDLEPVFATMLENAVRFCEAKFGAIYSLDGEVFASWQRTIRRRPLSNYAGIGPLRPNPGIALGRMVATKTVIQTADLAAERDYIERRHQIVAAVDLGGVRTLLVVPMLKEDELIGVFT